MWNVVIQEKRCPKIDNAALGSSVAGCAVAPFGEIGSVLVVLI
jgi:hypothetical protein